MKFYVTVSTGYGSLVCWRFLVYIIESAGVFNSALSVCSLMCTCIFIISSSSLLLFCCIKVL